MNDAKYVSKPVDGIKSFRIEGEQMIIPVIGIPFNGPKEIGGKDLHNEYFDKSTDIGPLNEAMVYFNHNRFYPLDDSPEELERMATLARVYKGQVLGIAKKAETTEEGVIYNLVLDMRKKYVRYLKEMIENNLLGVSSGAKYAELDPNNEGRISKWHTVEISLTPSPANPNAVPLAKSILERALEEKTMSNETSEVLQESDGVEQLPQNQNPTEELMRSLQVVLESPALAEEESAQSELESRIEELQARIDTLIELVKSIQTALPYIAQQIVERIDGAKSASTFERQVQRQGASNIAVTPKPAQAPVHSKNIFGNMQNGPKIPMLKAIGDNN